jgi:hypothetical protein
MDRILCYAQEITTELDELNTNRNAMLAIGDIAATCLGQTTVVNGLIVAAAATPNMTVIVGPGSIYSLEEVDTVAYSSLGTDTTQNTVKQGINLGNTTFTLTAPGGSNTTAFLIEAQLLEQDVDPTVLEYYNSTPPYTPFEGPGNSGDAQAVVRQTIVQMQLKSSTYATGGTPSIPGVDAGWTGLYIIPVNSGQTSITNGELVGTRYPGAPWLPQQLSNARLRLSASVTIPITTYGSDSWVQPTTLTPFATLQNAVNYAANVLDMNGQTGTITLGAGTFAGATILGGLLGQQGPLVINGAGSSSTTISAINAIALNLTGGADVTLNGVTIEASGTSIGEGMGVYVTNASLSLGTDVNFGPCGVDQIFVGTGGSVVNAGGYKISGGAQAHWAAFDGVISVTTGTITITGTPNYSVEFAGADTGVIRCSGLTFTGSATGTRYSVTENGVISTGSGASATYLPGNASGSAASGGQYT